MVYEKWELVSKKMAAALKWLIDNIFPFECLGCEKEDFVLCKACCDKFVLQKKQVCPLCYKVSTLGKVCVRCMKVDYFLDGLIVACDYDKNPLLKKCIHEFKYNFVVELAKPLAALICKVGLDSGFCLGFEFGIDLKDFVICPVPLHKLRLNFRGFNQAELLAKEFAGLAEGFKVKMALNLLKRVKYKKPQMTSDRENRLKNVEDIFSYNFEVGNNQSALPEKVLLIDDVATTTATLNACAKALKKAGVKTVFAITLARVY